MPKSDTKKRADKVDHDGIEITSRLMNIILEMTLDQQLKLLDSLDAQGYENSRQFTRTYLKKPWIVIVNDNTKENTHIRDICRNGMFIETEQSFKVGEQIKLNFKMPASKKILKITGKIVRSQGNGIAVKFLSQLYKV